MKALLPLCALDFSYRCDLCGLQFNEKRCGRNPKIAKAVLYILGIALFFAAEEQMGTSITLFSQLARHQILLVRADLSLAAAQHQSRCHHLVRDPDEQIHEKFRKHLSHGPPLRHGLSRLYRAFGCAMKGIPCSLSPLSW